MLFVGILVVLKNVVVEAYESYRGLPLSPPTEVDSLCGLLYASFYYLYLQV